MLRLRMRVTLYCFVTAQQNKARRKRLTRVQMACDSKGSISQNTEICYGKIFSKGFTALNEWSMNGIFCEASRILRLF